MANNEERFNRAYKMYGGFIEYMANRRQVIGRLDSDDLYQVGCMELNALVNEWESQPVESDDFRRLFFRRMNNRMIEKLRFEIAACRNVNAEVRPMGSYMTEEGEIDPMSFFARTEALAEFEYSSNELLGLIRKELLEGDDTDQECLVLLNTLLTEGQEWGALPRIQNLLGWTKKKLQLRLIRLRDVTTKVFDLKSPLLTNLFFFFGIEEGRKLFANDFRQVLTDTENRILDVLLDDNTSTSISMVRLASMARVDRKILPAYLADIRAKLEMFVAAA